MPPIPMQAVASVVRAGIARSILDEMTVPPQAIFNVEITPGPTQVQVRFETRYPTLGKVEIYRMVHGEISLDMEPENLVRIEVGSSSYTKKHSMTVDGLEQEKRYWYRVFVARQSPGDPTSTGEVRSRGEFATMRRNVSVSIDWIHVLDDSDTSGSGELTFSAAVYDATVAGGPRLVEPRSSGERDVASGGDVEAPFGAPFPVERAPDYLGILVLGQDNDEDASDIFFAPGGSGWRGMYPPQQMPATPSAGGTYAIDYSDALGVFKQPQMAGPNQDPFSFRSIQGALYFEVQGMFYSSVIQTLGPRPTPPWKLLLASKTLIVQGAAAKLKLRSGRAGLGLSTDGQLSRRVPSARGGWERLEGPRLDALLVHIATDGTQVLVGLEKGRRLHVARLAEPSDAPRWQALDVSATAPPVTVNGDSNAVHVLASDTQGVLWHARVDAESGSRPSRIAEGATGPVIARAKDDGGLLVVRGSGDGRLEVLTLDRNGNVGGREPLDGEFPTPLAIVEDAAEGVLLAAMDSRQRVALRRLPSQREGWEVLGDLDDVLEGSLERVGSDSPRPEVTTA